jgi:mevalonate kinase
MSKIYKACGKIVLFGEYGVLLGYKAYVASINRFAICTFTPDNKLSFMGIQNSQQIFNQDLFEAVLKACQDLNIKINVGHYLLDTSDFFDEKSQNKFGLGSSSAAISALCKAINNNNLKLSLLANSYFCKNLGSGLDIVAAYGSGITSFKKNKNLIIKPIDKSLSKKIWSSLIIVYTNKSQSTKDFVKNFLDTNNSSIKKLLKENEKLANNFFLQEFNIDNLIDIINRIDTNFINISNLSKINMISQEHLQIATIAKDFFGTAKISGAGGGDISLVCIKKTHKKDFIKAITDAGYLYIKLKMHY